MTGHGGWWTGFTRAISLFVCLAFTLADPAATAGAEPKAATAPTVTIEKATGQADPTNTSPVRFIVTFSAPVTGFTGADVRFTGTTAAGTLTGSVTGSDATYTVSITGMTSSGTVVASVPAGAAQDASGLANQSSTSSDNSVKFDNVPPTVTINQASFQTDPTKASLAYFAVKFSEAVTGFTAGDVSLAGSTAPGDLTPSSFGSGASYSVWVGGMTGPGKIVVSISAGIARDSANNGNLASTSTDNTVTYKPAGSTVTINQSVGQSDPTNVAPVRFDVAFSSTVTGFDASDISFAGSTVGGAPVAQVSGAGPNYTVSVSGMTGKGTLIASIPAGAARDSGNNNSFASTSADNAVDFDNAPPAVTINQAATQADPSLTSPILFTVFFSEPVTGFASDDVSFTGSTAGGVLTAALSGAGQTYTVSVTGMTTSGTVVASIPGGAVVDGVGNASTASTSSDHTVTYSSAPTVTINQAPGQPDPTSTGPISFSVVFSLPVTSFDGSDISFAGSTVAGTLAASVSGSGANYTVSVTGMTGSGTVVATIPAGAAFDAANKPSLASTSSDNSVTFDSLAPTVTINKAATQNDPTNTSPIVFRVTFNEAVTGFTSADVSLAGSTAGGVLLASVTGSLANYTVSVTGMTTSGNVAINIPADGAQDQVGHGNQLATIMDNVVAFDAAAPTVTIEQAVAPQRDPTGISPINFTVTFSEPVNGFAAGDVSFAGSTASGILIATVSGAGANYNVSVSGMTTPGTVVATIPTAAAQDAAGNASQSSTSADNVVTYDNVAPTVVINRAGNQSDPTSATPIVFTVVFSEPVTGFNASGVSLTDSTVGGALLASVNGSGANYTVSVSGMSGSGAVVARVSAGAATDAAGNSSAASTSTNNVVTYLPTGPTVTINQDSFQPDPTNVTPIRFTVVFSAPVTGLDASDISFTGSTVSGSLAASISGGGANYTVTVNGMTGTGVVIASIPAGAAIDGASNPSQASTSIDNHVAFDNLPAAVTINQIGSQQDPTRASPVGFTVTFSEPVTGFIASDVSFAGSTAGGTLSAIVSGSGANYTVSVTGMTTAGVVVASIPAGAATDATGNPSAASTSTDNFVTFDNLGPTVTVNQAANQTDPANASPILFRVEFSESVTGFAPAGVSFAGSTVGGTLVTTVSGSGASYTISVTGMAGSGTLLVGIPAGAATDLAGNLSAASASADNSVTYSPLGPTVTINQMPGPIGRSGQPDPTNASPILFSVVFSAPVTGFTGSDVTLTGSTTGGSLVATVSGSGTTYTVSVTGMSGNGTVVASIPADAALDSAGVGNRASTSTDNTVAFDTTPPTVTINQAPAQTDPTNASPIQFIVTFSDPVVGFNASDVSLAGSTVGGTLVSSVTGSGANYTVSVTGLSGTGTVIASIPAAAAKDAAGNNSQASTSADNTVTVGPTTGPSVTINQAAGQTDPTNGSPIQFTVVFSSPVTGFTAGDVNFAGSTVGGPLVANVTGSGTAYTVSVTGMTGAGAVVASIPAAAAIDGIGTPSAASTNTDNSVTFDNVAPTVTINQATGQTDPTNASPIVFTVAFSEAVTGFTGSDVSFAGSTVGGALVANVSGSGTTYAVSVTGMTGNGTVVASVPAGAALDAAGNLNSASTSTDNTVTFDNVAPTVTINQATGQADPTNLSPIQFTVVFSEPVTGFTSAAVSLASSTVGGALNASVSGSGATYTISVTGMNGNGTVVASIPAGSAADAAGNSNQASTSTDNTVTYNTVAPTVTINQAVTQVDPTHTTPIVFSVLFSTPVTGFAASDVSFTGSTAPGTLVANVTGITGAAYTVSISGMTGSGTVQASIPAGAAQDAASNLNQASTSTDNTVTFDNVAPTVTINQAAGQADPTNLSPIQLTVVFSEPVTGFTSAAVSLAGSTVGGALSASVSGSGSNYTVSVTGMSGSGTVVASISAGSAVDPAGNPNQASTSTDSVVAYNATPVTVTINLASGQADPTSALPIGFAVEFSAPVVGFSASDVSFAGSTAPGIQPSVFASAGGRLYTVVVGSLTASGTITASIAAGAATDDAGNLSQASTSTDNTVTYDVTGPRVTSASPSGTVGGPIDRVALTFGEAIQPSTFTLADVVSLNGPGGAIAATAVNALNTQQFEVVFPSQTSGTFTLVIGPDIRDLVNNPMDQNANGINGEPIADRYTTTFTIASAAVLTSVTPSTGQQGTNLNVIVNSQSTNFVNGVTTAGFSGTGISVNSVTVTSPTSATLNIDISPIATRDQRSVTLTTNTEVVSSSASGAFLTVTASPATITAVNPNHGTQSETLPVDITGSATHFANGSTSVSLGGGITVNSLLVNSPTSLTASVTIQPSASVGSRSVVVTTAGEIATGVDAFTVNVAPAAVASVSPATGRQNETVTVQINAQSTHFDNTTVAGFGNGISVNAITVTSATSATVEITIDPTAAPGARTVVMQTGLEIAQKVGAFTVQPGIPVLRSITPVAGVQGTNATLILNGLFTHFTQDVTQVSLGSGISLGHVTVNGPELASVPIRISDTAAAGPRTVTVTSSGESVSISNGFNVTQGDPDVTIIDPNAAQRGTTSNVVISGHFTNWQNGVTHVTYGAGITVNSNIVSSPTQITTNITIDPAAAIAPRDVVVTTGSDVLTVYGGFSVTDVDVTAPTILTASPAYGSTNVPLNVLPTIEWSEPLRRSTVNTSSIQLWDTFTGQMVPGSVNIDATGRIVNIVPSQLLAVSRSYYLYLGYTGQIQDVAGNPFGGTNVYFTTGFATDTTGPMLLQSNPENGDTDVPVNAQISLQFDRPINAATRASGLQILKAGVPVAGIFTFADSLRQINFAPAVPWEAGATYTIALSNSLTGIAGNALTNPGNRTFTAGSDPDTVGPQVVSASPVYGDVNVGLRPVLRVVFNERVNPVSINSATFYLYNTNLGVYVSTAFTVAADRLSATMRPADELNPYTTYLFQFYNFTDVAGNFGGGIGLYFTTGASVDTDPLAVVSSIPANGATNVPVNARVRVTMNELIDPTSVSNAALSLSPSAAGSVALSLDRRSVLLTLTTTLAPSTTYTMQVSGLRDLSGNVMTPFSSSFTTSASAVADTTPPTVVSFSPVSGSTNVSLTSAIVMTVSEPIDASSISDAMRVFVNGGSVQVAGTYSLTNLGTVVTFTPAAPYPAGTVVFVYANYDGSVTDLAGNALQFLSASFTTSGIPPDTTAPSLVSITPADGSTGVGPQAVVTLTFSESMNPGTNSYQNFAVFAAGVPLNLSIGRSADNRSVMLSGTWPLNSVLTVVATRDNTDLSGNHLSPFSSTFTTAAAFDSSRASIVTQLPIGSGVATATPITLYSNKPLNASTVVPALYVSQNGILVDGTVRVSGGGTAINFTPATPFAAGAVIQLFLTTDAEDIDGNAVNGYTGSFTIAPDAANNAPLVVRSSPAMGSVNNPLNSVVDIEFSEPLDEATVTTANVAVHLFGGGAPIAGTLSLQGNRIHFSPADPLQAGAYYYVFLRSGLRDTQGVALVDTSYYFYVGTAVDTTAPTIVSIAPANGMTNVGINAAVRVLFSEPINPLSVTPSSVTLSTPAGTLPVTFVFSENNTSLRILSQNPLPANTPITLSIDPSDPAGNELPPVQSQFTTGPAADTTAPAVVTASWTSGQTVAVNSVFQVVFNEPMDARTVLSQATTFLYDSRFGGYVAGSLTSSADARTFTFTPSTTLAVNRPYSTQLFSALDLAGNVMSGFSSYVVTDFLPDTLAPTVAQVSPRSGEVAAARNTKVRVLFDEAIAVDAAAQVRLLRNGIPVAVTMTVSNGNRLVTLTPTTLLASNATYAIAVSQVRDASGNQQSSTFTSSFTTGDDVDLIAPVITQYSPGYGQSVPRNVVFTVTFSEPIDPITLDATNFYMFNTAGQPAVPAVMSFSSDRRTATLTPTLLLPQSAYIVQLFSFADAAGNIGSGVSTYLYTTDVTDTNPPAVVSVTPPPGSSAIPVNARIVVQMNESIAQTTVINSAIQLNPPVAGTVTLGIDQATLTLTPSAALAPSTTYSIQVSGLTDLSGHLMIPFSSTFTTASSAAVDTTAPTVVSTLPVNGAAGVAVNSSFTFTTSEPITRSAIGPSSNPVFAFVPAWGIVQIAGTYSVDATNTIVTFTPTTSYPANTTIIWYTNYTGQITDAAGNQLQSVSIQFTTGATADLTAPTLVSVTPADRATDIGPLAPITLTFSESLSPVTTDYNNLALFSGSVRLNASISRSADNRMLFVSATLAPETTYTMVATSGIQDLSGNGFAGFSFSFTTAPFDVTRPSIVTQRPTGSGVSKDTRITLFLDSAVDPSTVPSATFVAQNGFVVAGVVTVSGGGRTIVFTPDAPFLPGSVVEITVTANATDPSRNPLYPYLGAFTVASDPATTAPSLVQTSPGQTSSNNPLNAQVDVEFSEPLNPLTVTTSTFGVYLFGGGTAIPGTLSLRPRNRTIHFVPDSPLQPGAYYYVIMSTGIQDTDGTAFAGSSYYFYVGDSGDSTSPSIASLAPPNGSAGVGINAVGVIRFTEPVNPVSVNTASVLLTSGNAVPFVLSSSSDRRTFYVTPQVPLPASTTVTLSVQGVEDVAGHVAPVMSTTFTTAAAPDTTRPSVVTFSPISNDVNVPVNAVLQILFDEPIDPGSAFTDVNSYLYDYFTGVAVQGGTVSMSGDMKTLSFMPPSNLLPGHSYIFWTTSSLVDLAGNPLNATSVFFSTSANSDQIAPTIVAVSPPALSNVPRNATIEILFDEPIRASALDQVNVVAGGNPLPVAERILSYGNRMLTVTLAGLMAANTVHTISVAGVSDVAGNTMATMTSSFTTGSQSDLVGPSATVVSVPTNGAVGVSVDVKPSVTFSEPVDPVRALTVSQGYGIYLYVAGTGQPVDLTYSVSADYRTVVITPTSPLQHGTQYQFIVYVGITDLAGNGYPIYNTLTFKTQ